MHWHACGKSYGTCLEDMHAGVDGLEEDHGGLLNLHPLCVAIIFPNLSIGALLRSGALLSIFTSGMDPWHTLMQHCLREAP